MRKNTEEQREEYDMCKAVREMREEMKQIGREEGRMLVVKNLLRRGDPDDEIMEVAECDRAYLEKARAML